MYVILVNEDNNLVTTVKERIMQRSKLVDELWFLVPQDYKGYSMADFTVMLEYLSPVSREYHSEILTLSNELYNEHLKYVLPFDTALTVESGNVEVQLTFALADLDTEGNEIQRVRKTSAANIEVVPISAWSDIIPDSALTAVDQRLIMVNAQIKALDELADSLSNKKADNISYDVKTGALQLTANGAVVGDTVNIMSCVDVNPDGSRDSIPIVLF